MATTARPACELVQHLRRPNPQYLDKVQPDVNIKMRAILVDWLVEVSEEYRLCADTLYTTINFLDRFMSLHVVQRNQLQLVGVSCMWLAAKYEEIFPPNVGDFCYITDNTYTKEQMIQMEELILKTLSYELTVPTTKTFLRRLLQVGPERVAMTAVQSCSQASHPLPSSLLPANQPFLSTCRCATRMSTYTSYPTT